MSIIKGSDLRRSQLLDMLGKGIVRVLYVRRDGKMRILHLTRLEEVAYALNIKFVDGINNVKQIITNSKLFQAIDMVSKRLINLNIENIAWAVFVEDANTVYPSKLYDPPNVVICTEEHEVPDGAIKVEMAIDYDYMENPALFIRKIIEETDIYSPRELSRQTIYVINIYSRTYIKTTYSRFMHATEVIDLFKKVYDEKRVSNPELYADL